MAIDKPQRYMLAAQVKELLESGHDARSDMRRGVIVVRGLNIQQIMALNEKQKILHGSNSCQIVMS